MREGLREERNKEWVTFTISALDPAWPCACPLIWLSAVPAQTPKCLCCKHMQWWCPYFICCCMCLLFKQDNGLKAALQLKMCGSQIFILKFLVSITTGTYGRPGWLKGTVWKEVENKTVASTHMTAHSWLAVTPVLENLAPPHRNAGRQKHQCT